MTREQVEVYASVTVLSAGLAFLANVAVWAIRHDPTEPDVTNWPIMWTTVGSAAAAGLILSAVAHRRGWL